MRDVILYSGWTWETFSVQERVALALAHVGCRVLYVENPSSAFHKVAEHDLHPIEENIVGFRPRFLGHRLQVLPFFKKLQANAVVQQIEKHEKRLGLRDALFLYPWMGTLWDIPVAMKKKGHMLIRMLLDQPELNERNRLGMADFTLLSAECGIHEIEGIFEGRACYVPQGVDFRAFDNPEGLTEPEGLAGIPRPRLCYTGPARPDRLNMRLVKELLSRHPEWHFVFFGENTLAERSNAHALPWVKRDQLPAYVNSCEVGFMPYNCLERQLHANPLKLWEYFALGKPVVAAPIIHLWEYEDVIYRGHSTEQMESAIERALAEPLDSPKRQRRVEIAREHSIEKLAGILRKLLPLD